MLNSTRVYTHLIEQQFWEIQAPMLNINNGLPQGPKPVKKWKSKDFLKFWIGLCESEYEVTPTIPNEARACAQLKAKVIDYFYDRVNEEIKTYLIWLVKNLPAEKGSKVGLIPYHITDFLVQGKKGSIKNSVQDTNSKQLVHLAVKQALEHYGLGIFDENLSKREYFIGLKYRYENLPQEYIDGVEKRQAQNLNSEDLDRLLTWRDEFHNMLKEFDLMYEFYVLESERLKKPFKSILDMYFAHENYYGPAVASEDPNS